MITLCVIKMISNAVTNSLNLRLWDDYKGQGLEKFLAGAFITVRISRHDKLDWVCSMAATNREARFINLKSFAKSVIRGANLKKRLRSIVFGAKSYKILWNLFVLLPPA